MDRVAQQIWDKLAPVHTTDLQTYIEGIAGMFQEADNYASDSAIGQVGWSGLLDLSRVPDKGLDWLAQFIGVHFPASLSAADKRTRIQNTDGWNRGSVSAIANAPKPFLSGGKSVIVRERSGGDPYAFQVLTKRTETPAADLDTTNQVENSDAAVDALGHEAPNNNTTTRDTTIGLVPGQTTCWKLAQTALGLYWLGFLKRDNVTRFPVVAGRSYTGSAYFRSLNGNDSPFVQINWYNSGGVLVAQASGIGINPTLLLGGNIIRTTITAVAPPTAVTAILYAVVQDDGVATGVTQIGGVQFEQNPVVTDPIPTSTGPASRGTGGGAVGAALREQKPAGLVMTYSIIDGNDFQSLLTNHALYSNVFADYLTYQGVLNDAPGT